MPHPVLRVLLVDDDPAFLEMLTIYLAHDPEIAVEGVAATLRDALGMAPRVSPDVVVLDVHLPDGDAALGTAMLRRLEQAPAVLVVSADAGPEEIAAALDAGANAFMPKDRCIPDIRSAIHSVTVRKAAAAARGG